MINSIIDFILKFAGVTYGPLLGLFAFGILTKRKLKESLIWTVCIIAPLLALILDMVSNPAWYEAKLHMKLGLDSLSAAIFNGYKIGNELILINGIITFIGLWFISSKKDSRRLILKCNLHKVIFAKNYQLEFINPLVQEYAEKFSSPEDALLQEVNDFTATNHPEYQMLSGHLQGKFLEMASMMIRPRRILEIGTFTGYSALCLAKGLTDDGHCCIQLN